jgi:hypothetical protein
MHRIHVLLQTFPVGLSVTAQGRTPKGKANPPERRQWRKITEKASTRAHDVAGSHGKRIHRNKSAPTPTGGRPLLRIGGFGSSLNHGSAHSSQLNRQTLT